jgi:hypothetical protein
LIQNRPAWNEIGLPVQDPGAKALQVFLDGRGRDLRLARIAEKDIPPLVEKILPIEKRNAELVGMQPAQVGVRLEFADIAAETHVEDDTAADILLN